MPWEQIPQTIAAIAFFGLIFICPLIGLFLRHQHKMAELIHARAANESLERLAVVERELMELKALQHERVLRDDDQRELERRVT